MINIITRPFQKLTSVLDCAKTRSTEPKCALVHEDSRTESTKQFQAKVEFPKRSNKLFITCTTLIIANLSFAEVPVVDDSENYALLEEQTITAPSSVRDNNAEDSYYEQEQALAHDSNDNFASNNQQGPVDEVGDLKQEIQDLRGQIEVLNHEIKKLKDQQLTFYKDLDARIPNKQALNIAENAPNNAEPPQDPGTQQPIQALQTNQDNILASSLAYKEQSKSTNTSPADEQISYLQAYELIKNKRFNEAVSAMQKFVTKYPSGYYSANAEYWLGELYLAEKNYPNAISHFDKVLQQYPTSNKHSASLLKLGYALAESGRYNEAKTKLQEVMQKYPDTNTSKLARYKLEEISKSI